MHTTLKARATVTISCNTCGCQMKRTKIIKVNALNRDREKVEAEAKERAAAWRKTLEGKNCKVCESILKSVKQVTP